MRLTLALGACGLLLAACGASSTVQQPTFGGGGITTLPPATQSPSPSPSDISPSPSAAPGQINAASLINTIEQQYNQNYGVTITVTCPRSGSFASVAGDSFQCNFTDANGHAGTMTVSVTSNQGDYNWTIP